MTVTADRTVDAIEVLEIANGSASAPKITITGSSLQNGTTRNFIFTGKNPSDREADVKVQTKVTAKTTSGQTVSRVCPVRTLTVRRPVKFDLHKTSPPLPQSGPAYWYRSIPNPKCGFTDAEFRASAGYLRLFPLQLFDHLGQPIVTPFFADEEILDLAGDPVTQGGVDSSGSGGVITDCVATGTTFTVGSKDAADAVLKILKAKGGRDARAQTFYARPSAAPATTKGCQMGKRCQKLTVGAIEHVEGGCLP
jgi:hypothetical protein